MVYIVIVTTQNDGDDVYILLTSLQQACTKSLTRAYNQFSIDIARLTTPGTVLYRHALMHIQNIQKNNVAPISLYSTQTFLRFSQVHFRNSTLLHFSKTLDRICLVKKLTFVDKRPDWLSNKLKVQMRQRDIFYNKRDVQIAKMIGIWKKAYVIA